MLKLLVYHILDHGFLALARAVVGVVPILVAMVAHHPVIVALVLLHHLVQGVSVDLVFLTESLLVA